MNAANQKGLQDRPLHSFNSPIGVRALQSLDRDKWRNGAERYERNPVEFACCWEEDFARILEEHQVAWQYKPRTFAVEWDEDGNFVDCFTPDFYLPDLDLYVELVPPDDRNSGAKARKVRLLRQQQPKIKVELIRGASIPYLLEPFLF